MQTQKFSRKPLYVDAVRVTKDNVQEIADWCDGTVADPDKPRRFIRVHTHRSVTVPKTRAFVGDWVLKSPIGFRVYSNVAFEKAFDQLPVSEGNWQESDEAALRVVTGGK